MTTQLLLVLCLLGMLFVTFVENGHVEDPMLVEDAHVEKPPQLACSDSAAWEAKFRAAESKAKEAASKARIALERAESAEKKIASMGKESRAKLSPVLPLPTNTWVAKDENGTASVVKRQSGGGEAGCIGMGLEEPSPSWIIDTWQGSTWN
jgi:hypothetical protein